MRNLIPFLIAEEYIKGNTSGNFNAYSMFVDTSGFTAMTEKLMKGGIEGAEIIAKTINNIFTPALEVVYQNNGFITHFAGDAFSAVFPENTSQLIEVLSSAYANLEIFKENKNLQTKFGAFSISVKIGLSFGEVIWGIVNNDMQNTYYFKSTAIDNAAISEKNCNSNEIVFDSFIKNKLKKLSGIHYKKKTDAHYIITSLKELKFSDGILNVISKDIQSKFYPSLILEKKESGEFREVISCFISLEETDKLNSLISSILTLTYDYGGYFNRLSYGDKGAFILVFFGAPVKLEKEFIRACKFVLSVIELGNSFLKIGMTSGKVFAGFVGSSNRAEYTAQGSKVNLAARFMTRAEQGEILIDKDIYKLIDSSFKAEFKYSEKFKGFDEPIPVYKLIKENIKLEKRQHKGEMVGREIELQQIIKLIEEIRTGSSGGLLYIDGLPGMGKSILIEEVKNKIEHENYSWFDLQCDEVLRKSFNPVIFFLNNYFSQENKRDIKKNIFEDKLKKLIIKTDDPHIKTELIRTKSVIGALINLYWDNSLYENLNPKERYFNSLQALKYIILAESHHKPVILNFEDGHSIDNDSLKFLEVLTKHIINYPIIIISTCRFYDDGSIFSFNLTAEKEKNMPVNRIKLDYFDKNGTSFLIKKLLSTENINEKLSNLIFSESEGNPFYIEQIINYLTENNYIDDTYNLTVESIKIPSSINSIIIARIDRLKNELKDIVKAASILGREFQINILSQMLQNRELDSLLKQGETEKIWSSITKIKYIFKHTLIREAVYQMQLKDRLRKFHKIAAEVIENLYKKELENYYFDLAEHYSISGIEDKTILYLEKAGAFAEKNYLNEKALMYYERLAQHYKWIAKLTESGYKNNIVKIKQYLEVLNKIINLKSILGKWDSAKKELKIIKKCSELLNDNEIICGYYNTHGQLLSDSGNITKAKEYLDRALEIAEELGNDNLKVPIINNIGTCFYLIQDLDKAETYYREVLKYSTKIGNKLKIGQTIANLGIIYQYKRNYDRAEEYYSKALEIFKEVADKRIISITYGNLGNIFFNKNKYIKAIEYYMKNYRFRKKTGDASGCCSACINIGNTYKKMGKYQLAKKWLEKGIYFGEEIGDIKHLALAYGYMELLFKFLGEYDRALLFLKKSEIISSKMQNQTWLAIVRIERAEINLFINNLVVAYKSINIAISAITNANDLFYLSNALLIKAKILIKLDLLSQADKYAIKAYELSKKVNNSKVEIQSEVIIEKIKYNISNQNKTKTSAIEKIIIILNSVEEPEQQAYINFEIFQLLSTGDLENKFDKELYKKQAVDLYKDLINTHRRKDYIDSLEELNKY